MARKSGFRKLLRTGLFIAGAAGLYAWVVKPRLMHLGASDDEFYRSLPGDELVPKPLWSFTQAITIHAVPNEIWPWLVQWGYGRGGFYSYDAVDRALGTRGLQSATRILPGYQNIQVGDIIPVVPEGQGFKVAQVDPLRAIVLTNRLDLHTMQPLEEDEPLPEEFVNVSWAWVLEPQGDDLTRLISRARADMAFKSNPMLNIWVGEPLQPGSAIMDWGMLAGIKRRVEAARWGIEDE